MSNLKFYGRCCEVGVSLGFNAETMLLGSKMNFTLVDDYKINVERPDAKEHCHKLLERFRNRIEFVELPSVEAAKMFPDGHFDYVYIDASHDYDNVMQDLKAWYPKVREYGIFAGHDFCEPQVARAVKEFSDSINKMFYGVASFKAPKHNNYWNFAQMCDWWMFKSE